MIMFILAIQTFLIILIVLTYPTRGNANRLTHFIKNVCLLVFLYINVSLAYAMLSPLLLVNFNGVLSSFAGFFNKIIIEPGTEIFGNLIVIIVDLFVFLPSNLGDYYYHELSISEGIFSLQALIISVSISVLLMLDITTKLLFVDKQSPDINHKFLYILNYTLTIITGIFVLVSIFAILPYYYELNEIIVVTPGDNIF